jgi:hypothetical protein
MRSVLLLLDRAGEPDDLGGQTSLTGFQDPTIGIGETAEVERQQLRERALGVIEAGLELAGRRAEGRDDRRGRRGHGAAGIAQQGFTRRGVLSDAPGGDDGLRLARAQAVARDRVGQPRLLGARDRRERVRSRRREPTRVDVDGDDRREAPAEGEAPIDPAPSAAEELGDLRRGELVVVGQGTDDARLVHGTHRAARRVGLQHPRFAHDAGRVLDDDRHVRAALARPLRQALEPVEYLVGAVAVGRHAQGQRGQRAGSIGARTPQRPQRGGQVRDRQLTHGELRRGVHRGAGADTAGSGRRSGPGPRAGSGP